MTLARPPLPSLPRDVALAIAGGGSLGSFEAGALHLLVERFRASRAVVRPRVFAGTSAGALNAFLSVVQLCQEKVSDPTASVFYRTWVPIGFDRLFRPGKVRATSGLSRRAFRDVARDLQGRFEAGFDDRCDVLLGLTATRIHPAIVRRARGRLRLPRMAARFLVRIRGRGPGRRPEVSNHLERPFLALERLPLDGPDADPFDALRQVVLASSAFPLAFAPQPIRHCPASDEPATCRVDQAREDLFIDGGIFEQNPIGLAADALIGEDGDGRPTLPAEASFYLLDPFERSFPRPTERAPPPPLDDAFAYALGLVSGLVTSARSQGVDRLLGESPEVEQRLVVSASRHAPYGDLGRYTLSFFERGFRRFDFWLGMLEARRAFEAERARLAFRVDPSELPAPFRVPADEAWRPFRCLASVLEDPVERPGLSAPEEGAGAGEREGAAGVGKRSGEGVEAGSGAGAEAGPGESVEASSGTGAEEGFGEGAAPGPCRGEEAGLVALAEVSRERVYDACRPSRLDDGVAIDRARWSENPSCERASRGEAPPGAGPGWARREGEDELTWVFRRLGARGYRFEDLGHDGSAQAAFEALRDDAERIARAMAAAQPGFQPLYVSLAQAAVDAIAYRPPRHIVHLDVGPTQVLGYSLALGPTPTRWLRATFGLEVFGLPTLLSQEDDYLGLGPTVGLAAEILPWSSPALQLRLGLGGGYLLGSSDRFATSACDDPSAGARPCSRPFAQLSATLHILELLRFSLSGQYAPSTRPGEPVLLSVRPAIGAQLTFP